MADDYITLEELFNTTELTGTNFANHDARGAIASASQAIDEYCGRFFFTGGTADVRYYTPAESRHLSVDDIVACTTFKTDLDGDGTFETTWTVNRDFTLEPLNAAADGKPYEEIRVHPASGFRFSCWPRSAQVTGQFGWPAVPAPVKQATTIMATRLMKRAREAPFGVVGLGIDNTAVRVARVDPDVAFLLDPFVRGCGVMVA